MAFNNLQGKTVKENDPRKELRRLAVCTLREDPDDILASRVLDFLNKETVTLVISQDRQGCEATAHPTLAAARREMISCMLDYEDDFFDEPGDWHEFLALVAKGFFQAAIDKWNEEAITQGSHGVYFHTHNGKVEKNYTVRDLKQHASSLLDNERRLGR